MNRAFDRIVGRLYASRLTVLIGGQILQVVAANQAAFWLRFDGAVPPEQQPFDTALLPLLILVRLAVFLPLRLHEGVWRYASIWDLRNIVVGVSISTAIFWLIVHPLLGIELYPRSVFLIDALLLICMLGGTRLARRFYATARQPQGMDRVLVYGAGDAGEMIVRDMLVHPGARGAPVGFIDDDPAKDRLKIHGLTVFATESLTSAVERTRPGAFLIAIPSAGPKTMRGILTRLSPFGLPIRTLPGLKDVAAGALTVHEIRDLTVADLLSRETVGLDTTRVRQLIEGQRVVVTGAGGSIGSELSRQIAGVAPSHLILIDRYENGLFAIERELSETASSVNVIALVADIADTGRVNQIFAEYQPSVVFHAAAHKHVPLMEDNPCEAVKNNVRGTRIVADASIRNGVSRFVLISTDKAVNPSSIMGATKQVAEKIVQRLGKQGQTEFRAVRFGNVLGSNGSVVPTFLGQIKSGGPVKVTHPEMRRYFMLIPEAVQLVMQAATLQGSSIYVLDMGDQIRVVDMAKDLIRLAGYIPEKDIEIQFTGVRPGEKLFEELVGSDERLEPSDVPKIHRVIVNSASADLSSQITQLEAAAAEGDAAAVRNLLGRLTSYSAPSQCSVVSTVELFSS